MKLSHTPPQHRPAVQANKEGQTQDSKQSKSAQKLSNSPFENVTSLSRKVKDATASFPLANTAKGCKIQDAKELSIGIESAAVCSACKYWKDHFNDTNDYIEDNRLPQVFQTALRRLFERLTDSSLLSRCLKGLTQNQNESIHGMLWRKCPKTQFSGKRRVNIAVSQTVALFNVGPAVMLCC